MRQVQNRDTVTLNSWKEIAAYFDRGMRTVQRWERELELPIHRIGKGPRSPVFAVTAELNFWLRTSGALREAKPRVQLAKMQARGGKAAQPRGGKAAQPRGGKAAQLSRLDAIEESHRLLREVHTLAQIIAENSVRQRKQAETLRARIVEMRNRFKG